MENIKKNPLSLQLNAEDFLPASNEEKQSLVVMRESVNFWKDGIRRLKKNKIAMVSFCVHHCHCHLCLPAARRLALQLLRADE